MPRLFIHKGTRVIRRATINPDVQPLPDEDAVDVTFDADLRKDGKFWKLSLDGKQVEEATDAEVDTSDVDVERVGRRKLVIKQELNDLIDDMAENGATLAKLTQYFRKIKKLR